MTIEFVNPYYTTSVRDYVAVPYPTGEVVRLWSEDGELIAEDREPGTRWAENLAAVAAADGHDITADEVEALHSRESFE
jgi:predicted transcriptional regulator